MRFDGVIFIICGLLIILHVLHLIRSIERNRKGFCSKCGGPLGDHSVGLYSMMHRYEYCGPCSVNEKRNRRYLFSIIGALLAGIFTLVIYLS